ncbi:MAG: antibiotic biosynthesis monooxygenase [Planctomycetia bacterium]|nr:antibiotic biosynthesis monooxygenase [Planctomycetia bacterium]
MIPRCALIAFILALALHAPASAQDKPNPIFELVKAKVKDGSKPFTMLVSLKVKDGMGPKAEAAFVPAIKATLKEKGCLRYELNRDTDGTSYILYERWNTLPDLDAHLKTAHIAKLLGELGDLLAGPPDVKVMLPAGE